MNRLICRNLVSYVRSTPLSAIGKRSTVAVYSNVRSESVRLMSQSADHSKLWSVERLFSAALIGVIPAAFLCPSKVMETLMAISIVAHSHWGIEAIAIDYIRPILFGNLIPKMAIGLVYVLSSVTLGGLLYIIYKDGGIVKIVRHIWAKNK